MKMLIPVSPGGHLTQSVFLAEKLKGYDLTFVTAYSAKFRSPTKKWKFRFVINPDRYLLKFMVLIFQSLWILLRENPKVIVSTGSNIPIPFFIIGKLMGKKLIYIESFSRVKTPSLSGRILYRFSDLFFVQWETMKKSYPNAIYAGRLA
ncbi:MAG: polysaccharide biosynthesis protein [Candidatus Aenigmarchaeota archaeon]|nr:polysaccharide biosynthesis protein [Candidatus Aenigmarchaeota archaeon]